MASKKTKTLLYTLYRLVYFLLILAVVTACSMVVFTFAYERTDVDAKNQSAVGLSSVQNIYLIDDTCSEHVVTAIQEFLDSRPASLMMQFADQEWNIIIAQAPPSYVVQNAVTFDNDNYDNGQFSLLGGLAVPKMKLLYVSTHTETETDIYNDFIHEFGHFVDYAFGYKSYTGEFHELYASNCINSLYNAYETSTSTEFFASSYMHYVIHPDSLQSIAPDVYAYFEELSNVEVPYSSPVTRVVNSSCGLLREAKQNLIAIWNNLFNK